MPSKHAQRNDAIHLFIKGNAYTVCDYISDFILRHNISYHIISYHIISYHIKSYHIIWYHIISNQIKSYHIRSILYYHILSYHDFLESSTISMLPPCAFDLCHNFHVPGWSDRKRLGRLGQQHSISFACRVRLGATILDRTCRTEEKRACWSTVGTGHSWKEMPSVGVTALSHHFAKRVVR